MCDRGRRQCLIVCRHCGIEVGTVLVNHKGNLWYPALASNKSCVWMQAWHEKQALPFSSDLSLPCSAQFSLPFSSPETRKASAPVQLRLALPFSSAFSRSAQLSPVQLTFLSRTARPPVVGLLCPGALFRCNGRRSAVLRPSALAVKTPPEAAFRCGSPALAGGHVVKWKAII